MKLVTPTSRFTNLPDYSFKENYIEVRQDLNLHYVDSGQGKTVLCLHGVPSWSFLYRNVIKELSGCRVIAPDFIGFGKSDKLLKLSDYTFNLHFESVKTLIHELDLNNINLVVQDWGGLIGLRIACAYPDKISSLTIMNTALFTGKEVLNESLKKWIEYVRKTPDLPIGKIFRNSLLAHQEDFEDIIHAYEAPFPDERYKAGAQAWPLLIPQVPEGEVSRQMLYTQNALRTLNKPTLIMFSDRDVNTKGYDRMFNEIIPIDYRINILIKGAGHFLQEDNGKEVGKEIKKFIFQIKHDKT